MAIISNFPTTSGSITDFATASWDTINRVSQAGLASTLWQIGDKRTITLATSEVITVRIEAFNHDDLSGGGKAGTTIGMAGLLATNMQMNSTDTNVGGWGASAMRAWANNTFLGSLPADLQTVIKQVNKQTSSGNKSAALNTTADKIWLFSHTELGFGPDPAYSPGGEGVAYPLFTDITSRNKEGRVWWLRSPALSTTYSFCSVQWSGAVVGSSYASSTGVGLSFGFCI